MRNPLIKRIPREYKSELGKQIAVFLFFVLIIGAVSGFIISADSMIKSYNDSFEKYTVEDGNFELSEKADDALLRSIEAEGRIKVYENFYKQEETKSFESKLRIFGERKEIDRVDLLEGDMPALENEIAIDRLYAENHKLEKGSTIKLEEKELTVCGIVALTDYSALFENPTDLMFDNDMFGVAVMSDAGFEALRDSNIHYSYSWLYNTKPDGDKQAAEMSEELINVIAGMARLNAFIPEYTNQAIIFTGNDMTGDRTSIIVFLYITVAILAFVFSITIDSTITAEAGVIGTLRASGYTRGELLRHYLIVPMLTLTAAAVVGNILGYTLLEKYMAKAYLMSYSLTSYEVLFNADAFIYTTVIPLAIMLMINVVTLMMKLRLSPLAFLRRDLSRRKKKKAFRLNTKIPIIIRFRLRIIFQNLPNYITLIVGSFLANTILLFGMIFEPMLLDYQQKVQDNMLAPSITVLKTDAETSDKSAEKGRMLSLTSEVEGYVKEDIPIYGIPADSRYVTFDHSADGLIFSSSYRDKYQLSEGDTVTLKEPYGDKEFKLKVAGFYEYPASLAVFADTERFDELFKDERFLNVIFSESKPSDIDDKLIASTITETDLTKTSRQLIRSMGSLMTVFLGFGIIMFALVIFLLAKIIIEKNTQSISMTKILGYSDAEIRGLYIRSTTIVAIGSILLTIPLCHLALGKVFEIIFRSFPGYFEYSASPLTLLRAGLLGVAVYAVTALLLIRKVKHIKLAEALKNVE